MLMGFIAGTYHISFYLSVAAARRSLDLIHKQRILSDKLLAKGAAENIPNFSYIYRLVKIFRVYSLFRRSLTVNPLFVI